MQKFRLLLLDANIVIELHKLGLWEEVVKKYSVTLTSTVACYEAKYWEDEEKRQHPFDLAQDIEKGKIACKEITPLLFCPVHAFVPSNQRTKTLPTQSF